MFAASIVGFKKSGKTTLCEALGAFFQKSGINAAAVKCSHHQHFDGQNTDTARLAKVYSSVAGLLPDQTALFWNKRRYIPDLIPLLDAEGLIVEGGKQLGWLPRILLLHSPEEAKELTPELALCTFGEVTVPGLPAVKDVAALGQLIQEKGFALPGLDCGECGRPDCAGLARDIVAGKASPKACKSRRRRSSIYVNGVPLAMNQFVLDIITGGMVGMLQELKGYAPGTIEIKIEN